MFQFQGKHFFLLYFLSIIWWDIFCCGMLMWHFINEIKTMQTETHLMERRKTATRISSWFSEMFVEWPWQNWIKFKRWVWAFGQKKLTAENATIICPFNIFPRCIPFHHIFMMVMVFKRNSIDLLKWNPISEFAFFEWEEKNIWSPIQHHSNGRTFHGNH